MLAIGGPVCVCVCMNDYGLIGFVHRDLDCVPVANVGSVLSGLVGDSCFLVTLCSILSLFRWA